MKIRGLDKEWHTKTTFICCDRQWKYESLFCQTESYTYFIYIFGEMSNTTGPHPSMLLFIFLYPWIIRNRNEINFHLTQDISGVAEIHVFTISKWISGV